MFQPDRVNVFNRETGEQIGWVETTENGLPAVCYSKVSGITLTCGNFETACNYLINARPQRVTTKPVIIPKNQNSLFSY